MTIPWDLAEASYINSGVRHGAPFHLIKLLTSQMYSHVHGPRGYIVVSRFAAVNFASWADETWIKWMQHAMLAS